MNQDINQLLTDLTRVLADALGTRAEDDGSAWKPPMQLVRDLIEAEEKVIDLANIARNAQRERDEAIKAYIAADDHIREKLQPEFGRLARGEQLSWRWGPQWEYNDEEAATRLATWWHGCWSPTIDALVVAKRNEQ